MIDVLHFENLLDKQSLTELQQVLTSSNFSWYWNEDTVGKDRYEQGDTPQFTHAFMKYGDVNSDYFYLIEPIISSVKTHTGKNLTPLRVKANLLYPVGKPNTHPAHADEEVNPDENFHSFIFYPFDCDGDTILYQEFFKDIDKNTRTVALANTPKENSCLFFNSNRLHASSNPVKFTRRIILNFIVTDN